MVSCAGRPPAREPGAGEGGRAWPGSWRGEAGADVGVEAGGRPGPGWFGFGAGVARRRAVCSVARGAGLRGRGLGLGMGSVRCLTATPPRPARSTASSITPWSCSSSGTTGPRSGRTSSKSVCLLACLLWDLLSWSNP